jgi:hypothetical protein
MASRALLLRAIVNVFMNCLNSLRRSFYAVFRAVGHHQRLALLAYELVFN